MGLGRVVGGDICVWPQRTVFFPCVEERWGVYRVLLLGVLGASVARGGLRSAAIDGAKEADKKAKTKKK